MKINNLRGINFKRAIKVEINSIPYVFDYKAKISQTAADDVVEIMKNKPNKNYDKQTSKKIANFIKKLLGDTKAQEGGFFSRIIAGNFYIFSGKEAIKAREIIESAKKEKEDFELKYMQGPSDDMPYSEQVIFRSEKLYNIEKQNINLRRDEKLLELVEDGEFRKPYSKINIETTDGKIKNIDYYSFTQQKIGEGPFAYKSNRVTKTLRV